MTKLVENGRVLCRDFIPTAYYPVILVWETLGHGGTPVPHARTAYIDEQKNWRCLSSNQIIFSHPYRPADIEGAFWFEIPETPTPEQSRNSQCLQAYKEF